MKIRRSTTILTAAMAVAFAHLDSCVGADLVTIQAESGALGGDFNVLTDTVEQGTEYITISSNGGGSNPGSAARVASYTVTFPAAGTYDLYARVRVGPAGATDDSFFYGNGFGAKSPATDADWVVVNSVNIGGFTSPSDVVSGSGSAGISVWKWINLSQYTGTAGGTPITFNVPAGNLTQTFQIGAREDGFDMDKFVFGTDGTSVTVAELDSGTLAGPNTNTFDGPDGIAVHRFSELSNGLNLDGANPAAGLALAGGVLVGTTLNGGTQGAGTAFYMSPDGSNFNTFHSFTSNPDARNPQGDIAVSGDFLFGTSLGGGNSGVGTVFRGGTNGSVFIVRNFAAVSADNATNLGGASPNALLALSASTVYGTTTAGGAAANGTVFSLSFNGLSFAVLHDFSVLDSNTGTNADGASPGGGLIASGNKLYGTASVGGAGGSGVVFSMDNNGSNFTTLHSFTPLDPAAATNSDGAIPLGGLLLSGGTLYGTTTAGGQGGKGTVFAVGTDGLGFTVLHDFSAVDPTSGTNADGAAPCAALALAGNVLYGATPAGGAAANGTVFAVDTGGATFNTLYSFAALSNGTNRYGATPVAGLLVLNNSLYGTTFGGGPGGVGTVFSLALASPPPAPAVIHIVLNPDRTATLDFLGGPNSTNVIQSTTALDPPDWQNLSTNVADSGGVWQFIETNTSDSARYYRSYSR